MCHKELWSCYFLPVRSDYLGRFTDMSGLSYFPSRPLSLFSHSSLGLPRDCLSCGGKWKHKQAESALWFLLLLHPLLSPSVPPLPRLHTFPLHFHTAALYFFSTILLSLLLLKHFILPPSSYDPHVFATVMSLSTSSPLLISSPLLLPLKPQEPG